MNPVALIAPFAAIFGLAIGSFLNVVAYRVPNGLSVVRPASACPGCSNEITARDNIPLLSWMLLGGRCRHCRMRISPRYPAVEAITGLVFVVVALVFAPALVTAQSTPEAIGAGLELVALLYLGAISVVLAVIDLDVQRLPNRIVYPSLIVGAVLLGAAGAVQADWSALLTAAIGSVAMFVFYLLLAVVYPGGMGMGDVKLAAVLGLYLGYLGIPELVVGTAGAFLAGGVFGILLLATGRARRGRGIPFGPWMLAGAWLAIFVGDPIADGYMSLVGLA